MDKTEKISLKTVIDEIKNTNHINELIFDNVDTFTSKVLSPKPDVLGDKNTEHLSSIDTSINSIKKVLDDTLKIIKNIGFGGTSGAKKGTSYSIFDKMLSPFKTIMNIPKNIMGGIKNIINMPHRIISNILSVPKKILGSVGGLFGFGKKNKEGKGSSGYEKTVISQLTNISNTLQNILGSLGGAVHSTPPAAAGVPAVHSTPPAAAGVPAAHIPVVTSAPKGITGFGKGISNVGKGIGAGIKGTLTGLSLGLQSLGNMKVLKGIGALALLGITMIPFAKSLDMMKSVGIGTIGVFATGLLTLGVAAKLLSSPTLLQGALTIAALGASIIPLAYALDMMKSVGIETIGVLAAGIAALGVAAAVLGIPAVAPFIFLGALAIGALGAALIPFAYAMNLMKDINWDEFMKAGDALTAFSIGIIPLATAVPLITASAIGLGLFAGGVKLLRMALGDDNGIGITNFMDGLSSMTKVLDPDKLTGSAIALGKLSLAIIALGGSQALSGMAGFFGKIFSMGSDNPIEQLIRLSKEGYNLIQIGDGVQKIADGIKALADASKGILALNDLDIKKLQEIAKFEDARQAGYTSWNDYEGHNFEFRAKNTGNEAAAIQGVTGTAGVELNQAASITAGAGGTVIVNNIGGSTNISSSSSNVNTSTSILAPSPQGSAMYNIYNE